MPRENAATKGLRYLTEARLIVRSVSSSAIVAQCRGDSGLIYELHADLGGWHCDCPALGRCSHLIALARVCVQPEGDPVKVRSTSEGERSWDSDG